RRYPQTHHRGICLAGSAAVDAGRETARHAPPPAGRWAVYRGDQRCAAALCGSVEDSAASGRTGDPRRRLCPVAPDDHRGGAVRRLRNPGTPLARPGGRPSRTNPCRRSAGTVPPLGKKPMLFRILVRYLRPYWVLLLGVVAFQALQAWATLALPSLNADIIDLGIAT